MKILFAHLLNNYTGSPKILAVLLNELCKNNNLEISVLTSKTDGILNGIPNVKYHDNFYRWYENKIFRFLQFCFSQLRNFFYTFFADFDVLYMNTVVPFGAALAAKIRRKTIIYHVHEVYINPGLLKQLYSLVMNKCASKVICVSNYVKDNVDFEDSVVVYNPVEITEVPKNIDLYLKQKFERKLIFMPTSLKDYKGVFQFVDLARLMTDFEFLLLCSSELAEMHKFFSETKLPKNLTLIGKQKSLEKFYREATISMNLSLYDKCIETFGLTVLESFDALAPVIAPNYGGPKEIIKDGKNGFLVDSYNLSQICECIQKITVDFETYKNFALNARKRAEDFDKKRFLLGIETILENLGDKID